MRSVVILNYSSYAPSSHGGLSQSANHCVEMEKGCGCLLPLTMILHPAAPSQTTQAALWTHRSLKNIKTLQPQGVTYYFGHEFTEMEAIFGHHRTQDLSDRLRRFGFQTHRAVNRYQVQSGSKERP